MLESLCQLWRTGEEAWQ